MKKAIYPGSFDPVTFGHLDIIERTSQIFDELVIGVLNNSQKNPLFSVDERVSMVRELTKKYPNVTVGSFDGLMVDYAREIGATVVIRGLRAVTDFEYELQIAQTNKLMSDGELETMFLTTSLEYSYLSSSAVKEIAMFHGDVSRCVPDFVKDELNKKFGI